MLLMKNAFLELSRKKTKTFLLCFVFTVIFTGELGALTVLDSARAAREPVLAGIGATVTLEWAPEYAEKEGTEDAVFTEEVAAKLASAGHVVGVNQRCSDYALPVDFKNCRRYEGEDPCAQEPGNLADEGMEDWVVLEGDDRIDLADAFRLGRAEVVSGEYPSSGRAGVLISRQLAEDNGLDIGSSMNFSAHGKEAELTVAGIYETKASFIVTEDNIVGPGVFAFSPFNRIYTDAGTAAELFGMEKAEQPIDVYVDTPGHVQAVGEEIRGMDLDWSVYSLVNTTTVAYSDQAGAIEAVIYTSGIFFAAMSAFSAIALFLVMGIWAARFPYEDGICLALGASRWFAVAKLFVSSLFIALPSLVLALPASRWLAAGILEAKNAETAGMSGEYATFATGLEPVAEVALKNPDAGLLAGFAFVVLAVVLVSCLAPAGAVCRLKPREILSGRCA
ncbi:MAG TPA: hypothetical protein DF613_13850 [Lachnospiraceae bacterium]|nr:hypothetical protein [Lachnospiraceae bacterium]